MKIFYFANVRIPTEKAHGFQIMKMGEAFSLAGAYLTLVLPGRINTREFSRVDPFNYYRVRNNFQIKTLKIIDPVFLIGRRPGWYSKCQFLFFILALVVYLIWQKNKSDYIFYTRDEQLLPLLQLFSSKVIWEAHNLPKNKKYYKKYWRKCWKIITITQGLKNELADCVPVDRIIVSPDAVDLEQFSKIKESKDELRKKLNLPLDKNLIVYTGHLYQWKGVQTLVDAAKLLNDLELVVIVGGTKGDIDNFKQKNQDTKNILVIGFRPQREISAYLKAADILVLPNSGQNVISQIYSSPLKMFEYMAAQKPIVASDLPSIREILNEQNAILVAPDNVEALAQGINLALKNSEFSAKIAKQAYLNVLSYTWDKRAVNIMNFLKNS